MRHVLPLIARLVMAAMMMLTTAMYPPRPSPSRSRYILLEDALSVGDVVDVAGTGGVVEDIWIRSLRLRDLIR